MLLLAAPVAAVPPAKPYHQLAAEVMAFLFSDVGDGGIRTNDGDPAGYAVPPYFYHYAIGEDNNLWSRTVGYPGYASVSYPAYTASVAIDAFLDYRRFQGDEEGLTRARAFADWILEHRTSPADLYGNLPYSTQTDGVMGGGWDGEAIMTDKPAMFGLRLLRLFDITGESAYWDAAQQIAETLVATQLDGPPADNGRWAWRVRPGDGLVTQDYTSHLQPAVRFFEAMFLRTGNPAYQEASERAWRWLLNNPCNPASIHFQRWEAFYEDQSPATQQGKQDHYSAHEMIIELLGRRPENYLQLATSILDTVAAQYLVTTELAPYVPVTLEWEGWPEATYAASLQFARTALLLAQALAAESLPHAAYASWARAMAAACSHGQDYRCVTPDGRMFTTIKGILFPFTPESWYEQNFNTVKYYLEILNLDPTLAPENEYHMLWADKAVQSIAYDLADSLITYEVAGGAGSERFKLAAAPTAVTAAGQLLPDLPEPQSPAPGYHWDGVTKVLTVHHLTDPVRIRLASQGVIGVQEVPEPTLSLGVEPNPFNPRTALRFVLPRAAWVKLDVFDTRGRFLARLLDERRSAGVQSAIFDGQDGGGRALPAGIYHARLEAAGQVVTRKLSLIR